MRKIYSLITLLMLISMQFLMAQTSVLDPNDPVVNYNSSAPPAQPAWGQVGKWVRTPRLSFNTSSYKAYIYNGMQFRLKWPKNYDSTKTYPIIIFFHGLGEKGTIYDNEYQLYHGGEVFMNAVDNGTTNAFLFYPQNLSGFFGPSFYDYIVELMNKYFIPQLHVDPYRVFVHGLSGGGNATWDFIQRNPKLVAGSTPISAATSDLANTINSWKYTPIWWFQGGVDPNPPPQVAQSVYNQATAAGGNIKLTIYDGMGHGVWYKAWGEANYFPFVNAIYKSNPWPLFGRTEFCVNDPINVTLGLTAGFNAYEWRKDGAVIPGASSNTLTVTEIGTYDARIYNGTTWSDWSHTPVVVKIKTATVSPAIQIAGLMSNVIPTPEGKDSVVLQVPTGYASYLWKKSTDNTTLGTNNTFAVRQAGDYVVKVTEQYGCSSDFSDPFRVIAANGANAPDAISALQATAASRTQITLNWSDKPNPVYNETAFEVYRTVTPGTGYTLIAKVDADVLTYTDNNLNPNTKYYYIIRPVNNNGAAPVSSEVNATTMVDSQAPTAPGSLTVTGSTANSVSLAWTASTDDVGVDKYDIYINGVKSYTVNADQTTFLVGGLTTRTVYAFTVKARDLTGNVSNPSNQVSAVTITKGLNYKYYNGTYSTLPNFNNLTPVKTGISATPDLSVRTQDINYAILWQGYINIPVTGSYKFETNSDDGSKLYIGTYNPSATALVNNDGLHGSQYASGTINLNKGSYPITISFFQQGGGANMQVYWTSTAAGINSRTEIPASAYTDTFTMPGPPVPASNVKATAVSFNKINLTWNDNSSDETGFEIYRSESQVGPFEIIGTAKANATSYTDSLLAPQTTYYYQVQALNRYGNAGPGLGDISGLKYDYYEATSYSTLPAFTETPVKSGITSAVTLDMRNRDANYAIKYSGYINIPTAGQYTFYTASNDGSRLYIDGFGSSYLVVDNNGTRSSTTEKTSVKKTLTAGRHQFYVTYFQATGGQELHARYMGPNIAKQDIPSSAFENNDIKATTFALPAIPTAPSGLTATAVSPNTVNLKWNDNSNNETGFDIYRSVNTNGNYVLLTSIGSSDSAYAVYSDTALTANTNFYYKVKAKNEGGISTFSNEASTTTLNSVPTMPQLTDKKIRYDAQLNVPINATDADGDVLTITSANLPAFGTLTVSGNGTGNIIFTPTIADVGTYSNIQVSVSDGHGGQVTRSFNLTIDNSYPPVLNNIANVAMAEKGSNTINMSASETNSTEALTWNVTNLPTFATLTTNGNNASIVLAPGYGDNGTYPVTVTVSDNNGGVDSKTFNITVTAVNPNYSVYINFNDGTYKAPAPWNNTNKLQPALNDVFSNMLDNNGRNTGISMKVMTNWQTVNGGANTNNFGYTTNNNSGIYPDAAMVSAWFTMADKQTLKLSGFDTAYTYSFTFFGSRAGVTDPRTAGYTVNGTTVSLNASSNTSNTVTATGIRANSDSTINVDLTALNGSAYAYLNTMVIQANYDDGKAPAKPGSLNARSLPAGVRLNWVDRAYNETGYEVYRATSQTGPFQLLSPVANANDTAYTDPNVSGNHTYYYVVRAINTHGGTPSDTVSINLPNMPPVLDSISNVAMKTDAIVQVNLHATDDPSDVITISATGLPVFATLQNTGNGTATLKLAPSSGNIGTYTISVTARDDKGAQSSRTFKVQVTDKNMTSVYVNYNRIEPAPAPWNNFNSPANANTTISNILDESGTASGINITLLDALTGDNNIGAVTGNNSGVYPDVVMHTFYYDQSGQAKRIRLSGLSATLKYNLVFFASREAVSDNRNTIYSAGGQSVTLNAASNTQNTVQINGLSPDANGNIDFTLQQASGSFAGYIGAMVIQSYVDNGIPLAPANLVTSGQTASSIQLTWADKSSNETGFEIWRSTDRNGTYTLLTTTAANVTTYNNTGLSSNSLYFYKVRAITATKQSDYSNIAAGGTLAYGVNINFNTVNPAPAPWNNTNALPYLNQTMANPKDGNGNPTSFSWTIIDNFTGTNPAGFQTGNNSGVYPDLVIAESYYVEPGDTAKMQFSNLDQSKEYSFTFFGSRASGGTRITAYNINGRTVTLDAYDNSTNTVTLDHLSPDQNGQMLLVIYTANNTYGYLNALVIKAFPREVPQTFAKIGGTGTMATAPKTNLNIGDNTTNATGNAATDVSVSQVYPNPFTNFVNVALTQKGKGSYRTALKLLDFNGRIVTMKDLGLVAPGSYQFRMDITGRELTPGVYLLQVIADNQTVTTIKLVKQ
ncbi:fibronectin type III domain-containing protein [Chitinophaga qingshengii]|uniref:Fibronectin type III domain-containing protein n=1 Tax=Chitinophaga qingshengii TaxID=1569794 RepID=A0ABR7TGZ9_9BACT|nr:fibronectin type III domain-containing protein [Chitinophaga qingshengii]MBC9928798.1 fibronectin type III domain-containing protein [Chitinophaga qingshengii]